MKLREYHEKGVDENEVALKASQAAAAKRTKGQSPRQRRSSMHLSPPTAGRQTRQGRPSVGRAPPGGNKFISCVIIYILINLILIIIAAMSCV